SAAIRNVIDRVRQVTQTEITVLIQGESGVGKELIAHAIHELSRRRHEALLIVNCGAIPEGLIESELFGAEKGAYTGAVERRTGYFEEADRGTIFLDEIGEMPASAQVRLLRVLESGQFTRVGSSQTRKSDARIIAATNKDLAREVRAGRFREDLYYRLSTVIINIPPLRERKEDIIPLFETFLHSLSQKYDTPVKKMDDAAYRLLRNYRWPGNVRELRNVAEQAVVLLRGDTIREEDLRPYLRGVTADSGSGLLPVMRGSSGDANEPRERELIYRALLELRMDVRDMKEQLARMAARGGLPVARTFDAESGSRERGDYLIVRDDDRREYASLIEDVPFEIESEEESRRALTNGSDRVPGRQDNHDDAPLPTLEDAERDLINRALKKFEGNRRQTAKALGISERTLYRKLKEEEEEEGKEIGDRR
ncbi:MAG: sigma 54-interacting transcriptional regulator, partial [Rhodothermales bacterium]